MPHAERALKDGALIGGEDWRALMGVWDALRGRVRGFLQPGNAANFGVPQYASA